MDDGSGGAIELNDLLRKAGLDPSTVMVMRHRPTEKTLRDVLPWLAADRHELYNAYQCHHGPRVEAALMRASHLVSLIGHEARRALFVGVYEMRGTRRISRSEFRRNPLNRELLALGTRMPVRPHLQQFDIRLVDALSGLKGRLSVEWPGIERAWWRWAARNVIPVYAIHEESRLVRRILDWQTLVLRWEELALLPGSWRAALSQWRGVYYIFDTRVGKGYIGSAAGSQNLLGRWLGYSRTGHGGSRLLRASAPQHLEFSILQRVSPDMDVTDVVALENDWKLRLHSRVPHGLNEN